MARRSRRARRPGPWWSRGPSVLVAVVLLALAFPDRAAAHANLVSADPQPLASTDGVPRQVQLHFGQPTVPDSRDVVTVTTPSGTDVALGRAVVNGLGVAQRLGPSPERGWYTVHFHVAFVDGHVRSGAYRFRVAAADRPPPDTLGPRLLLGGAALLFFTLAVVGFVRRSAEAGHRPPGDHEHEPVEPTGARRPG